VSPRPRKVSDEDVFAATIRAMSRLDPGALTLAAIAEEAGLTAGALVQRFGSKRDLLLELSRRHAEGSGDFIAQAHAERGSALAALRFYAECLSGLAHSPAALSRNLAYLQIDLTDPDFRKHLAAQAKATREAMEKLLEAAVAEGDLVRSVEPARLARTVEAVLSGAMMTWGFYRQGTAAKWMREELDAVLAPYLTRRSRRQKN
jgi:AcrR family transcriptional regulator